MRIVTTAAELNGEDGNGIEIGVQGFNGDPTSASQFPTQVYVEVYGGVLRVCVWDGSSEDPEIVKILPLVKVTA